MKTFSLRFNRYYKLNLIVPLSEKSTLPCIPENFAGGGALTSAFFYSEDYRRRMLLILCSPMNIV